MSCHLLLARICISRKLLGKQSQDKPKHLGLKTEHRKWCPLPSSYRQSLSMEHTVCVLSVRILKRTTRMSPPRGGQGGWWPFCSAYIISSAVFTPRKEYDQATTAGSAWCPAPHLPGSSLTSATPAGLLSPTPGAGLCVLGLLLKLLSLSHLAPSCIRHQEDPGGLSHDPGQAGGGPLLEEPRATDFRIVRGEEVNSA